jgi:hypothetical protein
MADHTMQASWYFKTFSAFIQLDFHIALSQAHAVLSVLVLYYSLLLFVPLFVFPLDLIRGPKGGGGPKHSSVINNYI